MVQLTQIVTANAAAFLLLIIVKLHMKSQISGKGLLDTQILRIMMNLTMLQCGVDSLVFWIDGKSFEGARELNYIGNIVYFTLNVTISYFWPLFTEYKINSSYERLKKLAIILGIPLVIVALLIMSAPLNGIIFTVSDDNIYSRTGLYFMLPSIAIFGYIIYGTMKVYVNRKKEGKYMLFPAIYFITPVSLGIIVQSFNYGISLIFIGIAIGITGVYMSTQNESAYIDQLCGVYNRRYYNDYIRSFCNSGKKDAFVTGILIDMDNFKPINDNFGHHIGDKALMIFSSVLRKHMSKAGFAVRYGGDEFILISTQSEEAAEDIVASISEEIEGINASGENEFRLEFSYGTAVMNADTDSEDFLSAMDTRMYEMKKNKKADR